MGLLKETMQAIIRIDRNLAAIRKELAFERDAKYFRAVYQQKPIEQVRSDEQRKTENEGSLFDRLSQLDRFPHPDHLTFGGRLKAVRAFWRLKQDELASEIGVSPPHISNLEADKSTPSAMLIRSVSRRFSINETWLATGHLPQTIEEPATPIATSKVTPLSGYENAKGFDWGDPAGDRPVIMTLDELKQHNAGEPLQSLEQMKEQVEGLMGFYQKTSQDDGIKQVSRVKLTTVCDTEAQWATASERIRELLITKDDRPLTNTILSIAVNGGGSVFDSDREKYHKIIFLNITTRS
jgi:transcriptional regulator with XRE-family HTH domain